MKSRKTAHLDCFSFVYQSLTHAEETMADGGVGWWNSCMGFVELWGVARRDASRRVAQFDWLGLVLRLVGLVGIVFGGWLGLVLCWLGLAWLLWFRVARHDASRRVAQPDLLNCNRVPSWQLSRWQYKSNQTCMRHASICFKSALLKDTG